MKAVAGGACGRPSSVADWGGGKAAVPDCLVHGIAAAMEDIT